MFDVAKLDNICELTKYFKICYYIALLYFIKYNLPLGQVAPCRMLVPLGFDVYFSLQLL